MRLCRSGHELGEGRVSFQASPLRPPSVPAETPRGFTLLPEQICVCGQAFHASPTKCSLGEKSRPPCLTTVLSPWKGKGLEIVFLRYISALMLFNSITSEYEFKGISSLSWGCVYFKSNLSLWNERFSFRLSRPKV